MFNVLLDRLPTEYKGFPIDTDFGIGIQITQVLEDEEFSKHDRMAKALNLLFVTEDKDGNRLPIPDIETAMEGMKWFLTDWNHDNHKSKNETKVLDYDIDQWRIHSAFLSNYGIDLKTQPMHYWEFMGLLTNLPECAFTRVVDIRSKVIDSKMSKQEKEAYKNLKEVYSLNQTKSKEVEYTDSQKESIDEHDKFMEEQKKIRESKKLAQKVFEDMTK